METWRHPSSPIDFENIVKVPNLCCGNKLTLTYVVLNVETPNIESGMGNIQRI